MALSTREPSPSDEEENAPPFKPQTARHSRDDLSANEVLPDRTRPKNKRLPTAKQRENEDDEQRKYTTSIEKRLKQLEKANATLRANANASTAIGSRSAEQPLDGFESEERSDEDEDGDKIAYPSALRSTAVLSETTPKKKKKLVPFAGLPITGKGGRIPLQPLSNKGAASVSTHHSDDSPPRGRSHTRTPLSPSQPNCSSSSPAPSATSKTSTHTSTTRKRARDDSTSLETHDDDNKKVKKAHFAHPGGPTGRAKARDYEANVCSLINEASREYECLLLTQNPFPDMDERTRFARLAWRNICQSAKEDYILDDRILKIIINHGSRVRGDMKDKTRSLVTNFYKLQESENAAKIKRTKEQVADLLDDSAFRYKDPVKRNGFAQNKIVLTVIKHTWFKDKSAHGVHFPQYFNPITLETLALVFTAVEFCIEEWSEGKLKKGTFTETDNKKKYDAHIKDLQEWNELNSDVIEKIRKKMYMRAREHSGAAPDEVKSRLTEDAKDRARMELDGRTGETDSESEEESEN